MKKVTLLLAFAGLCQMSYSMKAKGEDEAELEQMMTSASRE